MKSYCIKNCINEKSDRIYEMRNTEKDKYWREMIRKQGELRHFGSMAIRKSSKGDLASAQEVDLLFRVACQAV